MAARRTRAPARVAIVDPPLGPPDPPRAGAMVLAALDAGGEAREAAMQAVYDWISANTAACPLVVSQRIWAVNPRVKGFGLPATDYDLPFKGITLG